MQIWMLSATLLTLARLPQLQLHEVFDFVALSFYSLIMYGDTNQLPSSALFVLMWL